MVQFYYREYSEDFKSFKPEDYNYKYTYFLYWTRWNNFYVYQIGTLIYSMRGLLIFCHLCTCPIFRQTIKDQFSCLCCKQKKRSGNYEKFGDLMDLYENSSRSFLYSSLNMEIVCSILKGINVVLRDINLNNTKQTVLAKNDFEDIKVAKLKSIEVLSRVYFEQIQAKELKIFQRNRNST